MAKARFNGAIRSMSGKVGGMLYIRDGDGYAIVRDSHGGAQPHSEAQAAMRGNQCLLVRQWRWLDDVTREQWAKAAERTGKDRNPEEGKRALIHVPERRLSAFNTFIRANHLAFSVGRRDIIESPRLDKRAPLPPDGLRAEFDGKSLIVRWGNRDSSLGAQNDKAGDSSSRSGGTQNDNQAGGTQNDPAQADGVYPAKRLCHNGKNAPFCHSERSEESDFSMSYANEILRLSPQNDNQVGGTQGVTESQYVRVWIRSEQKHFHKQLVGVLPATSAGISIGSVRAVFGNNIEMSFFRNTAVLIQADVVDKESGWASAPSNTIRLMLMPEGAGRPEYVTKSGASVAYQWRTSGVPVAFPQREGSVSTALAQRQEGVEQAEGTPFFCAKIGPGG